MRKAPALTLSPGDQKKLFALVRSSSVSNDVARLAGIVVLASEGLPNTEIAQRLGVSVPTVRAWRNRYRTAGITALTGSATPGQLTAPMEANVVVTTLRSLPSPTTSSWSAQTLSDRLSLPSPAAVSEVWLKWGLDPRQVQDFRLPTQPKMGAEVRQLVGLLLDSEVCLAVFSLDASRSEQTAGLSVSRAAPLKPDVVSAHRARGHVATTLFTALSGALERAPQGPDRSAPTDRGPFLRRIAEARSAEQLHVIVDTGSGYAATPVRDWLTGYSQFKTHLTRTTGWWLRTVTICTMLAGLEPDMADLVQYLTHSPIKPGLPSTWEPLPRPRSLEPAHSTPARSFTQTGNRAAGDCHACGAPTAQPSMR